MFTQPVLDRGKTAFATLLALLLLIAGAITAPAAHAAGPTISASPVPREGGVVTVTGSGFAAAYPGVYIGLGQPGLPGFYAGTMSDPIHIAVGNADGGGDGARTAPMTAEGSFRVQVTVPAFAEGAAYALYTSKAHGQGFADPSQNTAVTLEWQPLPAVPTMTTLSVDPAASSAAGASFTLGAIVEPTASGTVAYFDGAARIGEAPTGQTVSASVANAGTAQLSAVFSPADPATHLGSTSAVVPYPITPVASPSPTPTEPSASPEPSPTATVPPEVAAPELSVSKTAGLDAEGEPLTITAKNYPATAASRYTAGRAGFYIQVGWLSEDWRPSEGAASSTRTNAYSTWIADALNTAAPTKWSDNGDGTADASWTVEVTEAALDAKKLDDGTLAVFTTGAGGVVSAPSEIAIPIAFAEPDAAELDVTVTEVSRAGGVAVAVKGSNLGSANGAYAAIIEKGTEAELDMDGGYVAFALPFPTIVNGSTSFSLVAPTAKLDRGTKYEVLVWKQHAVVNADTIYARADLEVTPAQWKVLFPGTTPTPVPTPAPTTPTTPMAPTQPAPTAPEPGTPAAAGSLRWAISSSFSSYVTGPIAKGSIATTGGATRSGSLFQFGQGSGTTFDPATGTGTVSYVGGVRFTGHAGILDVTVSNPQIRATSASSAALYVTRGGTQVHFANLDLAAATRSSANGSVTFTGAPATLTGVGRSQVFQGYSTTLDPLTFTVGVAGLAPTGQSGTVAVAAVAPERAAPVPSTPPASAGIELDSATLAALGAGEYVEVSASGFAPNETGIRVVVYSTPTVLGEVSADASGTATWKGALPATLADGDHTLTFQGSVDRGIRFELARSATELEGCVIAGADLRWGFKESFRTYIEGIAAGGWELDDVVYEFPEFVWAGGEGSVDVESKTGLVTYGGTIRFTGHDGALDTTLSNARLELAGDTGYVVFDVAGTTQEGEPMERAGIRFAEFALPDLEITDAGLVLKALPTTLTDTGAEAFGTYPAGEAMDAVSATIPVDATCGEPVTAATGGTPIAEAAPEAVDVEAAVAEETAPAWPWALGGLALVLALGAVAGIVVARRRAAHAGGSDLPGSPSA